MNGPGSHRKGMRALRRGVASLLFTAAAATQAQEPAPLHYRIRTTGSELRWELPATLHTVHGKAPQLEGSVDAEPGPGGKWKITGRVAVAAAAMETGNGSRDRKMREKILEVDRYPEILFETTRVAVDLTPLRRGQRFTVEVTGDLTIHGKTLPVRLPVDVEPTEALVVLSGTFPVNWREYGLADPSFGLIRVREVLKVVFRLEAEPVATSTVAGLPPL